MTFALQRVLFPTDWSEASTEVFERAVALAAVGGAQLRVVHVRLPDDPPTSGRGQNLAARANQIVESLHGGRGPVDVELVERPAPAVREAILAEIDDYAPDLVVMATHGGGLLMGSVAEYIARHSPAHVMTCRRGAQGKWPRTPGRILVPVDFSDNSRRALALAREIAEDSPIALVHVVDAPPREDIHHLLGASALDFDPDVRRRVEDHLAQWADGPVASVSAVTGDVRQRLLEEAARPTTSLVVVGTHGPERPGAWILGSTAERLVRASPAPVVVVR